MCVRAPSVHLFSSPPNPFPGLKNLRNPLHCPDLPALHVSTYLRALILVRNAPNPRQRRTVGGETVAKLFSI